ncbi:5'-methylthioadenosine/S-adenosylhomocysteine nucleosidase [Frankia sp. AgB32]|uniref:5'-methylthioadenosine/S-adenosylhomocysteine nucleosidase family protein n=1 Tax=Frankia sp. AgB32 TaxID=631119 RepID=UPI00200D90C6|nr:5'-methylthioadenosine/S-adenosylhomocysteine nucleosidase [Frankia sp. AgB32]MCK9895418.1 5'-methylthioadenosine/S-adenosylhomocysteine nucleosidase [Frankia sp. AgB32]
MPRSKSRFSYRLGVSPVSFHTPGREFFVIAILTALSVEHDAVRELLVDVEERTSAGGTIFDVGRLATDPEVRIALGVTGTGALNAATLAERVMARFSPAAALFVGVAGGLRDWLEIGDVVVATKIHGYQAGRSEDSEFLVRPNAWLVSHELEQLARRLPRDGQWRSGLPSSPGEKAPAVHFEAVAAGDVVLNSRISAEAERIRRSFNDAVAVEMESSGFAHACHLRGRVPTATIRAISDRADGTKSVTDGRGSQRLAAANAAAFAAALATAVVNRDEPHDGQETRSPNRPAPAAPTSVRTSNVVRDGRVGVQSGSNTGEFRVTFSGSPDHD